MNLHTIVLRKTFNTWAALCLENGIVGQGETQDRAIEKLTEAIESFQLVYDSEPNIYSAPIPIQELHEFLTVEAADPIVQESYEFRAVYA